MTHAFPTRRSSDLHLGVVSLRENDLPGAIALFRRAVAMDPTYAEAGFNLGVGLRGQDDLAGAAAAIDAALEHDPDNDRMLAWAGILAHESGQPKGAAELLMRAVDPQPARKSAGEGKGVFRRAITRGVRIH